ncbi:MAG: type II toxin-antitoxin system HicA family toxin [Betaproteobacteria bacterium]|nr:type II toxin-antitoxin system HicA family toxin [Betaproteobacteria bacterium]
MGKFENTLESILRGSSDQNVAFGDLRHVLSRLGFDERIKGDHFIFSRDGVVEIINLQPIGNKAKAYQVKQVRNLIVKYKFAGDRA